MPNITITNNDNGSVILKDAQHRDELLTFAGADTFVEGTILARKVVADAVTASAVTGTGNGTVTLATVAAGPVVPLVGAYVLTCTEAVTNGGIFKLVDPNGAIVATDIQMTAGAGGTTVVEVAGLQFTITDGSTDFVAGDYFTLTVATNSGKMVPFNPAGAGGAQEPSQILTYEQSATGAGDVPIRGMLSGTVKLERLVVDTGEAVSIAYQDQLRTHGIVCQSVTQLNIQDNQP